MATESDAMREYAQNVGRENQDVEWVLTPYDTWQRNPHYTGKPGRHPEDESEFYDLPDHDHEVVYVPVCDPDGIPF